MSSSKVNGTPIVPDIQAIRDAMSATHESGVNRTYAWRTEQLGRMQDMIDTHIEDVHRALQDDLGMTHALRVNVVGRINLDLAYFRSNLRSLMKSQHRPTPLALLAKSYTEKEPLLPPAVLVIGPSNYPISISLLSALGALAAGNPVVLKPSEMCSSSEKLLAKIVPLFFEPGVFQVVTGGADQSKKLLSYSWGKIIFTGSERIGRIVAEAGAKTLTPVLLELGGTNPAVIDDDSLSSSQITNICDRIIDMKLCNCGQTCLSMNTLFIMESQRDVICNGLVNAFRRQFGAGDEMKNHGRIVSPQHAKRHVDLILEVEKDDKAKLLIGGSKFCKPEEGYVHPTIVLNPSLESRMVREEIFGPILPIVIVSSRVEAIRRMRELPGTPLAMYVYTSKSKTFEAYKEVIPSGTVVQNDAVVQFLSSTLPFGGLGTSGHGSYLGRASFDAFTHERSVVERPIGAFWDLYNMRMHPFSENKLKVWSKLLPIAGRMNVPVLSTPIIWTVFSVGMFVGGIYVGQATA